MLLVDSTHDATWSKSASINSHIINGLVVPDRKIALGNFGEIPLVTVGDSAFPRFSWLIKSYNENNTNKQQKYFNKRLFGATAVTKNAYGMLKGDWRILFKRIECRLFNLRYIILACIALHSLCISVSDTYKPRWKLHIQDLGLIKKRIIRNESNVESNLNRMKISNWLWMDHWLHWTMSRLTFLIKIRLKFAKEKRSEANLRPLKHLRWSSLWQ